MQYEVVMVMAGRACEVIRAPVFVVFPHGSRNQVLDEFPECRDVSVLRRLLAIPVLGYDGEAVQFLELPELLALASVQEFVLSRTNL